MGNMDRVVRLTLALGAQRAAIQRCIELMSYGMHHFQRTASLAGLAHSPISTVTATTSPASSARC